MVAEQHSSTGKGLLIQFTKGMVSTFYKYFENYASARDINLEFRHVDLWLINPRNSSRKFLEKATLVERNTIRDLSQFHCQSECGGKAVAKS